MPDKNKVLRLLVLSSFRAIDLDTGEEKVVLSNRDQKEIIGREIYANFKENAEKLVINNYIMVP